MVKFESLAPLPVDYFPHSVMSSLVPLLYWFIAFLDTNRSPNPNQKTRVVLINKKQILDLNIHIMELKNKKLKKQKNKQILGSCQRTKN